jgi:EmrB/QacA subfamily drug resistance transporter
MIRQRASHVPRVTDPAPWYRHRQMITVRGPAATGAPRVRPHLVLAICCTSLLMVSMDATIVNVALPAIRRDLLTSTSGLQWVIDAYTMVVASLLMVAGSLADRLGRRRTFQTGLVVFTVASALCSAAPGLSSLIVFRMVQALGASMLNPVAMSIITNTFIEPRARARAIGVWGAVVGISMALGPLVGGGLTQAIGWRSIFWINLPIGGAAIVLAQRFVPESKAPRARRIDPLGQLLVFAALAALTYAVIEGPYHGWTSPLIGGLFALAAGAVIALILYEPRRAEPLLDLRFFRSVPFASATVIAVSMYSAFSGFLPSLRSSCVVCASAGADDRTTKAVNRQIVFMRGLPGSRNCFCTDLRQDCAQRCAPRNSPCRHQLHRGAPHGRVVN